MNKDISLFLEDFSRNKAQRSLNALENKILATCLEVEKNLLRFSGLQIPSAFSRKPLEKFISLEEEAKWAILKVLEAQNEFIDTAIEHGFDGENEIDLLKYAMSRLNIFADQNIIDSISEGDIIEILDENCVQIYRSLSCFDICNYSLIELTSYPWFELYERSSNVTKQLMSAHNAIVSGEVDYWSFSNFPEYTLRELMTDKPTTFKIKEKFSYRLRSSNQNGKIYILSVKKVCELEQESNINSASKICYI